MPDYYKILGLRPGASITEIKKAYRKLAFKYHPDVYKGDDAENLFLEISEAYEMLTQPRRGRRYRKDPDFEKQREEDIRKAKEKAKENMRKRYSEFKAQQEEEQSRQYRTGIYIFLALTITFLLTYTGYGYWYDLQAYTNSDTTVCQIAVIQQRGYIVYFEVEGKKYSLSKRASQAFESVYGENEMPLSEGQEYLLIYNKDNPKYCDVLFEPLSPVTIRDYLILTQPKIMTWLTEEGYTSSEELADCIFYELFNEFGAEGWAAMFYYDEPMIENWDNNAWTFDSYKKQYQFRELVKECTAIYHAEENSD